MLAVMAPRGPVVLVGHSMGGMTVLSHARQYPHRYPTRIVGVALILVGRRGISGSPLGEILKNPALEAARFAVRYAPKTVHRGRGAAKSVLGPILRAASYGDEKISPSVVAFSEKMMHDTPIATLVEFLHALEVHDETAALPTLAKVPTLIACGDHDLLTPMEYSEAMAAALPKAELVIVEGAGHLVQLEQPEAIDDALVRLVERATPSKLVAMTRRLRERADPMAELRLPSARLAPRNCRPPPTPSRSAPGSASSCAPATWWCSLGRWVRERRCWPRESPQAWMSKGPVTSPTFVLARVHPARRPGSPAMVHVDMYRLLDHAVPSTCSANSTRWTSTPTSTTRSWWWSGEKDRRTAIREPPRHPARALRRIPSAHRDLAVEPGHDAR